MKYNVISLLIIATFIVNACTQSDQENNQVTETSTCDLIDQDAHYREITGTLVINSKGEFVFKGLTDDSLGITCSTFLVPCHEDLNEYIKGVYDGFASIRNRNENFWITVTGKYLNLAEYKKQGSEFKQLEFMYNHVAIVDEPEDVD